MRSEISFGAFQLHVAFPGEDEQRYPQLCEARGKIKHEISWGSGLGDAHFLLFTFPSRKGITRPHPEKRALVVQLVKNPPANGLPELHWVWCNGKGSHLELRQEPKCSSPFKLRPQGP